ncbi:MAG: NADH-quinone oxidoreductase subunit K [Anaerosomatales bacterium]|nr:NADH-quinone oxidoreductase subunit K [Anaerosomatales bacterium]
MSAPLLYALVGAGLVSLGAWGLVVRTHPVRKTVAANLMGSGAFLILVSAARATPAERPDPVPHALVLTGIVVTMATTAVALALAKRRAAASEGHSGEGASDG